MAEIVFILGAGASKHAGAPLMFDFLQTARYSGQAWSRADRGAFDVVDAAINSAQRVLANLDIDISNVETLFNALEVGALTGTFPDHDQREIEEALKAIRVVIAQTLEYTVSYPTLSNSGLMIPHHAYAALAGALEWLVLENSPSSRPAVITFNYDIAFEVAVSRSKVKSHYNLSKSQVERGPEFPLLKLHGSINWWSCPECEDGVHALNVGASNSHFHKMDDGWRITPYTDRQSQALTCESTGREFTPDSAPFIVPPTWNKTLTSGPIKSVWESAARHLSEARHIVVIGYSFPSTDEYFRLLLGLSLSSGTMVESFTVVDPFATDIVERLEPQLGPALRRKIKAINETFWDGIWGVLPEIVRPDRGAKFRDTVSSIQREMIQQPNRG